MMLLCFCFYFVGDSFWDFVHAHTTQRYKCQAVNYNIQLVLDICEVGTCGFCSYPISGLSLWDLFIWVVKIFIRACDL